MTCSALVDEKSVVELGCGVGAFGLVGCKSSNFKNLILTDGELKTEAMVNVNKQNIPSSPEQSSRISYSVLKWGCAESVSALISEVNGGVPFDVAIGCELMYYRTNIPELMDTVLMLTNSTGLFVHAHLFRKDGQEQELIDHLEARGWATYELPHSRFVDPEDLQHHPEWYKVRALISGPLSRMEELLRRGGLFSHLVPFREQPLEDEEEGEAEAVGVLFKA